MAIKAKLGSPYRPPDLHYLPAETVSYTFQVGELGSAVMYFNAISVPPAFVFGGEPQGSKKFHSIFLALEGSLYPNFAL